MTLEGPLTMIFYQAFVSEYAVTGSDAGKGTLVAALAEAGFLIGIERNRSFNNLAPSLKSQKFWL